MRHNPSSSTGWVDWMKVSRTYRDSGEGGMAVYAVLAEDECTPDSFIACVPYTYITILMSEPDAVITRTDLWKEAGDDGGSVPLVLAMCLGGSGGSWYDNERGHFQCTMDDLTSEGLALMNNLTRLYGRCPTLVTVLDT